MDTNDFTFIQNQIGYHFKNTDLLQQAFVRRSYSNENGGENNEVLEFIGDKVLDFIVVKLLADKFGYFTGESEIFDADNDFDEFCTEVNESTMTELKKSLVQKKNLSECVDALGLAKYLIMGKSDKKQHAETQMSVKEDLFEAILGAVAIDCDWKLDVLQETVEHMLRPDSILEADKPDNYVALIQKWCAEETGDVPEYQFTEAGCLPTLNLQNDVYPKIHFNLASKSYNAFRASMHHCLLKITKDIPMMFQGIGKSKSEARKDACKNAYDWLEKNGRLHSIKDELDNPNRDDAIGQLEILARRGYFSLPTYEFKQVHDENGDPVWTAECHVEEAEYYFDSSASTKKDAKKDAAYQMLKYVLAEF